MRDIESSSSTLSGETELSSSEDSWRELTKLGEGYDLPVAKVASAMKKFSEDYEDIREEAYADYCERESEFIFEFEPELYAKQSQPILSMQNMVGILKKGGHIDKIPKDLIQAFGDSLADSALYSSEWGKMSKEDKVELSQIFSSLRQHGFEPFRDGRSLKDTKILNYTYTGGFVDTDPYSRAWELGLVESYKPAIDIIASRCSRLSVFYEFKEPEKYSRDDFDRELQQLRSGNFEFDYSEIFEKIYYETIYIMLSVCQLCDNDNPPLSPLEKNRLVNALPPGSQGFIQYCDKIGGSYRANYHNMPLGCAVGEDYFNANGPTSKFWQLKFDEGDFAQISKYATTSDTNQPKWSDLIVFGFSTKQSYILKQYNAIGSAQGRDAFRDWCKSNYVDSSIERINLVRETIEQLSVLASPEIRNHLSVIASQLLEQNFNAEDVNKKILQIENIFEHDDLPYVSKAFATFQLMHPPETLPTAFPNFSEQERRASPILMELADAGKGEEMAGYIYSKLFTVAAGSNNPSLRKAMANNPRILEYMDRKVVEADAFNRKTAKRPFRLLAGDMIKGLGGVDYIENSLENGVVCKEMLGEDAKSDTTPLDTDLSLITQDAPTFEDGMSKLEANEYGPIWVVVKADENRPGPDTLCVTRRAPSEQDKPTASTADRDKIEVFYTGRDGLSVQGRTHMGIAVGFPTTRIDGFIVDGDEAANVLKEKIAKGAFYIPVYDKNTERLIFTPRQYNKMHRDLQAADSIA